ncbi:MAG: hypothetical protein GXP62_21470 [Oligoflexia bacterium]|nr:hypothetical protein [Oligoflexia bacterium]
MSRAALAPLAPLALILACAPASDPCDGMCQAAADLYGTCLSDWGQDWGAAGYDDQADFVDRCQTWAWEARILERDAGEQGAIDPVCEARAGAFAQAMADPSAPDCAAYTGVEWDVMPW